eukprot:4635582-Pyramimonas_sp.AAC.1
MQPDGSRPTCSHDGDAPPYIPEDTHPGHADGARGDCNPRQLDASLSLVEFANDQRRPRRAVIRSSPAPKIEREIKRWARRWIHNAR